MCVVSAVPQSPLLGSHASGLSYDHRAQRAKAKAREKDKEKEKSHERLTQDKKHNETQPAKLDLAFRGTKPIQSNPIHSSHQIVLLLCEIIKELAGDQIINK